MSKNKDKVISLTEDQYMKLVNEIIAKGQKELIEEKYISDVLLIDSLAGMKFAIELKQKLFGDNDEE